MVHYLSGADLLAEAENLLDEGSSKMCPTLYRLHSLYCKEAPSTTDQADQRARVVVVVDNLDAMGAVRDSSIDIRGMGVRLERSARGVVMRQFLTFCEDFCAESSSGAAGSGGQCSSAWSLMQISRIRGCLSMEGCRMW